MVEDVSLFIQQIKDETDFFSKAKLIRFLIDKKGIRISEIAKKIGIQASYVCHILRLNHIPELIIDGYYSKMISLSHLFVISRIKDQQKMIEVYEQILQSGLTVFQTEEKVRDILHQTKTKGSYLSHEVKKELIDSLHTQFPQIQVTLHQTRIKSILKIKMKGSLDATTPMIHKLVEKLMK